MNTGIKCNVKTCTHNDVSSLCSLDSIVVGNTKVNATCMHDTECVSFESK